MRGSLFKNYVSVEFKLKVLIFKYVENVPCSALVDKKMQNLCWVSKLPAVIYFLYGQKLLSFMNLNLMCKC